MAAAPATRPACAEAGFSVIEATVATGVVAVAAGAMLAAVASAIHLTGTGRIDAALASTAQNVLVDLRAATVYDPAAIAKLAGRTVRYEVAQPQPGATPGTVAVTVRTSAQDAGGAVAAEVTVADPRGPAVRVRGVLRAEAPAPGAVVDGSSPSPSPTPESAP